MTATISRLASFDYAQRLPGNFQMPARMTVLPLAGGKLALISPIPIDDTLAAHIAQLGEVAFLIAPNLLHHLYLGPASERYPAARVLAPRGLGKKRPDLRIDSELEAELPSALSAAVEVLKVEGAPAIDEFVFFHRALRVLVVTDLVFNIVHPRGLLAHVFLYLMGCHGRLAQSRSWHFLIKQRTATAASVERMLALPFDQLVVAHGDILAADAQVRLREALLWLLPRRAALPA
jgi:hypothetical protein